MIEIGKQYMFVGTSGDSSSSFVVTVLELVAEVGQSFIIKDGVAAIANSRHGAVYRIDRKITLLGTDHNDNVHEVRVDICSESNLRPIDDDQNEVVEWEALKDIWVPEQDLVEC